MLPITTNNTTNSCIFLDLPEDPINEIMSLLDAQDVRNYGLVCAQLHQSFQRHYLNLPEDLLHRIFISFNTKDLKNCSLTCRQLGRAIHKDSFWQKKSFLDLFPAYVPMFPYKEWYQFTFCRHGKTSTLQKLETKPHFTMSSCCYTLRNELRERVSYQSLLAFTSHQFYQSLPTPNQVWMLEEDQMKKPHSRLSRSSLFLAGPNAFLYSLVRDRTIHHKAYSDRTDHPFNLLIGTSIPDNIKRTPLRQTTIDAIASTSLSYMKKWAFKVDNYIITVAFAALPQEAKNQVYNKLYEIMQPSVHYWGWGEDAFYDRNGVSSTDQQKIAAIQSYATSCKSNRSNDAHYFKMLQFFHLSQEDRNNVYKTLYMQSSPSTHYWGWGEDALHDKNDQRATRKQKATAIDSRGRYN